MARPDFPIPQHSQGNDILETSRNAALTSAANLLETLSHARDLKRRARSALEDRTRFDADEEPRSTRDFLFDMLRLNASYLNELAKLGTHHKDLVRRALDNLYSSATSSMSTAAKDRILRFDRDAIPVTFVVQNDVAPETNHVVLEWENVVAAHTPSAPNPFAFALPGTGGGMPDPLPAVKDSKHPSIYRCRVPVTFAIPKVVQMSLLGDAFLERRYHTTLTLSLALDKDHHQIRRIPVELDMRDKAEGTR